MGVDATVIERRLAMILKEVEFLKIIRTEQYDMFMTDEKSLRSTSKAFETIAQSIIDICSHIVAQNHWGVFETYRGCILQLEKHKIISESLSNNLQLLIAMRNLLVHEYGDVDYGIVWSSLDSLETDSYEFISALKEYLNTVR